MTVSVEFHQYKADELLKNQQVEMQALQDKTLIELIVNMASCCAGSVFCCTLDPVRLNE